MMVLTALPIFIKILVNYFVVFNFLWFLLKFLPRIFLNLTIMSFFVVFIKNLRVDDIDKKNKKEVC